MPLRHTLRLLMLSSATALAGGLAVVAPVAASTGTFTQPEPIRVEHEAGTFTSGTANEARDIPDGSAVSSGYATSVVRLAAEPDAVVSWVDVTIAMSHPHLDDVDLVLAAPDGRVITLASDIGGATSGITTLTFSSTAPAFPDEAVIGPDGASSTGAPVDYDTAGDFDDEPRSAPPSLRDLGGAAVAGDWTLHVYDDSPGHVGSVGNWTLTVVYGVPAAPSPSTLLVSGLPQNVTDVDLVLDDVNGSIGDTEFLLESPDGRYAHVLSDVAVEDITSHVDLTLDDEAADDVSSTAAPISGNSYRPRNYDDGDQSEFFGGVDTMDMDARLSAFDGAQANGTWKLWVYQEYCCATVTIDSWSLQITGDDPPAPPAPPAPPGPAGPGATDTTAPLLSNVRLMPTRLPTGVGARMRVTSTEPARLLGLVQRKKDGEWARAGAKRWTVRAGVNTRLFYGKTAQGRLRSGQYRVLLVATDLAGNASSVVRLRFSVDRG